MEIQLTIRQIEVVQELLNEMLKKDSFAVRQFLERKTNIHEADKIKNIIEGKLILTNSTTGLSRLTNPGREIANSQNGLSGFIQNKRTSNTALTQTGIMAQFEPPNLFKVKNGILKMLDRSKHENGMYKAMTNTELYSSISLTQRNVDIETVTVACERLKIDDMVELLAITENRKNHKSYFVTITPNGHVFIGHGGYSESSSSKTQKIIKTITKIIGTILMALFIAYLIFKLGWN